MRSQAASAARGGRPLVVVDLSMPPAVEPGDVAGVTRIDLATLEQAGAPASSIAARRRSPRSIAVIERELRYLDTWARRQALRPIVSDLRQKVEAIRRAELARACARAGRADGDPMPPCSIGSAAGCSIRCWRSRWPRCEAGDVPLDAGASASTCGGCSRSTARPSA